MCLNFIIAKVNNKAHFVGVFIHSARYAFKTSSQRASTGRFSSKTNVLQDASLKRSLWLASELIVFSY